MKDIWYIWCAVPGQNEWISRNKSSDLILSNVRDNSSNSEYSFHTLEENIAGQVFPNLMETVFGSEMTKYLLKAWQSSDMRGIT